MADTKISGLPASTTPLAGTEVLPIVQSSSTVQVSVANLTAGRAVATGALTVTGTLSATGNITSTTGNVVIGTAGKGIDFSATASGTGTMTSELLADYEEGTFTPVIASTGGGTNTYIRQNAKYTKVGRLVSIEIDVRLNVNSMSSGDLTITGLPFANGATVITAPLISSPPATSAAYYISGYILAGQSTITLNRVTGAATEVTLTTATFASGESLAFTFSYTV